MKLVIDLNAIATGCMLTGKDPDGILMDDDSIIPTHRYGLDIFNSSMARTCSIFEIDSRNIIGVFDAPGSRQKRQKIYTDYKAHREPRPIEYYSEFNRLMDEVCNNIKLNGGIIVSAKKTEADDVIAHIAPKLPGCIVWTRDKDALGVLDTTVFLGGDILYARETCEDKFDGILRRHVPLYRALVGDTGDFGKGMSAKGFGPAAFAKVREAFGDNGLDLLADIIDEGNIKALAEDVGEVKELQKIIDSAEIVQTTWALANHVIVKDHQLNWDISYPTYGEIEFVTKDNFDIETILYEFAQSPFIALDIESDVPEESKKWLADISKNIRKDAVIVDVLASKICGMGITCGKNLEHTWYFSVDHKDTDNIDTDDLRDLIQQIPQEIPIICHNASGFEIPVIYTNWDYWIPNVKDSMIAASYVDENQSFALKMLSMGYMRYDQTSYGEVTKGRGMSEISGEEVLSYGADDPIVTAALWNLFEVIMRVEGTYATFLEVESDAQYMSASAFVHGVDIDLDKLAELQAADWKAYDESYAKICDYLIKIKWPGTSYEPIETLTAAEVKKGFKILTGNTLKTGFRKLDKLAAICIETNIVTEAYAAMILQYDETGEQEDLDKINEYLAGWFKSDSVEFKPNSWVQLSKLLYEEDFMNLPIRYRSDLTDIQIQRGQKEGNPSTDVDAIAWAKQDAAEDEDKVACLKAILRCKATVTRNGLYYKPYKWLTHWSDGKIHSGLRQSMTTSRRYAPSSPNVNQLPKRSEDGKKIRGCIIPHCEDGVIFSPDYKGQELVSLAWHTQDQAFMSCYVGDDRKDIHSLTGFSINQKQDKEFATYEEFSKALKDEDHPKHKAAAKYRDVKAKPTNFLSNYTLPGGGAWTLGKKLRISEKEAEEFLQAKSDAFPGVDIWKDTEAKILRKQKYTTTLMGARRHLDQMLHSNPDGATRTGLNFKIQSSCAEQTKLAMGRIWRAGVMERYNIRIYFPVHDEITFSISNADFNAASVEIIEIMQKPYSTMGLPVVVDAATGPNFEELS